MRLEELVHLHALFKEVRDHLEHENAVPAGAFEAYDAQSVRPPHVHRNKAAHENAIHLLLEGIQQTLQTHSDDSRERPLRA